MGWRNCREKGWKVAILAGRFAEARKLQCEKINLQVLGMSRFSVAPLWRCYWEWIRDCNIPLFDKRPWSKELHIHDRKVQSSPTQAGYYSWQQPPSQSKWIECWTGIDLEESNFWTDSTTVLKHTENESTRFWTFVANQISLIREASKPSQWRYVSSLENPVDQASRGLNADNLIRNKNWIKGPCFLLKPQWEWPVRPEHSVMSMQGVDGNKFNTWQIFSGIGGRWNIYLSCRNVSDGPDWKETLRLET